jgi:hypothetical protein
MLKSIVTSLSLLFLSTTRGQTLAVPHREPASGPVGRRRGAIRLVRTSDFLTFDYRGSNTKLPFLACSGSTPPCPYSFEGLSI